MKKITILVTLITSIGIFAFNFLNRSESLDIQNSIGSHLSAKDIRPDKDWKSLPDSHWQKTMTPLQYKVTRKHGTERAFTGKYWDEKREGTYHCSACGLKLFASNTKFKSGTGWPSFFDVIDKAGFKVTEDTSFGMTRTEVSCSRCDSHLGHIFNDGPNPTGLRYCINSVSLIHSKDLK